MNEEEKRAITIYENFLDDISKNGGCIIDIDYQHKEEYQAMWKVFRLIQKQQAEIEKQDKIIKYNKEESDKAFIYQNKIIRSMAEFMFHNYYRMTYVDEWQFEEKIQQIIGDFERKIEQ